MKKYGEYKGTDIPWIDSVPCHWQINNIWQLFFEVKCKNTGMQENNLLSLSYGKVVRRNIEATEGLLPENFEGYNIIEANDIVLRLTDLQNDHKSLRTGLCRERGIITSAYLTLRAINQENAQYIQLLLHTYDIYKVFYNIGASGVRQSLNWDTFKTLRVLLPPRHEQDQIVRFLDYKTAKIDKLISGYKRQIELLEESKLTVIDEAVIHGVDNAELKDSGTNWIRKIPVHWEMVFSKKLFAERKDKAFPDDEQLTASQKYGVITQRDFMEREQRRVTVVMKGEDILKHVGKGDFVISMRSFQGGLEYSYVEGKISSAYVMLIPRKEKVYDEYFKWLLKSRPYIKALQGTADLVRDGQALRYANFAKVSLPIIPLDEQKRIAEYIEAEIAKINRAIPLIQKQITLLQEYRTRLISDVVTGQVDVRDETIPETEVN